MKRTLKQLESLRLGREKAWRNNKGKPCSENTKNLISLSNKGKHRTEEFRIRMSFLHKGQKTWLGKKHSEESKEKMRKIKLGRKNPKQSETKKRLYSDGVIKCWNKGLTKETNDTIRTIAKKKSESRKGKFLGEKSGNWRGGLRPENMKIRSSPEMKDWRIKVFRRDNYTCQRCSVRGKKLNAHHQKPFYKYKELRLDLNNGLTLCENCHYWIHSKLNPEYLLESD